MDVNFKSLDYFIQVASEGPGRINGIFRGEENKIQCCKR